MRLACIRQNMETIVGGYMGGRQARGCCALMGAVYTRSSMVCNLERRALVRQPHRQMRLTSQRPAGNRRPRQVAGQTRSHLINAGRRF
jgi:hypothetical protein